MPRQDRLRADAQLVDFTLAAIGSAIINGIYEVHYTLVGIAHQMKSWSQIALGVVVCVAGIGMIVSFWSWWFPLQPQSWVFGVFGVSFIVFVSAAALSRYLEHRSNGAAGSSQPKSTSNNAN